MLPAIIVLGSILLFVIYSYAFPEEGSFADWQNKRYKAEKDTLHKIYLLNELESKGFDKAIFHKIEEDVEYLTSIKDVDLVKVLEELNLELAEYK